MTRSQAESHTYHYGVVARAIAEIDGPGGLELTLSDLAARMGMSPSHFQRVFSRWAGISPKRYQQYRALGEARRLLATRHTTLSASREVGLSGAGRLHDLFITWEGMRPGAYARAGEGETIRWGWYPSPFGPALAMATPKGLCGIAFAERTDDAAAFRDLAARWPAARFIADPEGIAAQAQEAFAPAGRPRLHVFGGPFQLKVWEALLHIPDGHVTTYSDIARALDSPAASRAVGTAVGRNPLAWLIPCHRVLRRDGTLGGYHWGLPLKRAMLALEAARGDGDAVTD